MRLLLVVGAMSLLSLAGCGESHDSRSPRPAEDASDDNDKELQLKRQRDYVVRARSRFGINTRGAARDKFNLDDTNEVFKIEATVRSNVEFDVNDTQVVIPADLFGASVDLGSYRVEKLRDNNLYVCGRSRGERCVEAIIRVYTKNTPKSGLWNERDQFGAPIATSTKVVGLGTSGAVEVAKLNIPTNMHVLMMKDFTGANNKPIDIPVAVDFSDASAGNYRTEVVVEYILR